MTTKQKKIYAVVGYKQDGDIGSTIESTIIGYATTKKSANEFKKKLKDRFIPKYLTYADADMIIWRYNGDINAYLKGKWRRKASDEILRSDWAKWRGINRRLKFDSFGIEEIYELSDETLPKF